ncbi:DUF4132 domain-containing protein [Actinoplanes utahensis]|nr:DUF4132 domain-containing protein [Actinoplanes utahensis]
MRHSEDSFVMPEGWLKHRCPRRGSAGVLPFEPDPEARAVIKGMVVEQAGGIRGVLDAISTDEGIAAAASSWRAGAREAPPVGAAAIAVIKAVCSRDGYDQVDRFADLWIGERGLVFAVIAAVEMASLTVVDDTVPPRQRYYSTTHRGVRHLRDGEQRDSWSGDPALQVLLRVRAAVAAAPEEQFEQVVAALEPFRAGLPYTRVACSVLVPRADWVEQDVADAVADSDSQRAGMLLYAAGTAEQAGTLAALADTWSALRRQSSMVTLLDGVGAGAAAALFHWCDADVSISHGVGGERWLLSGLAVLPGDDVMQGLIDRVTARNVKPALLEAAERFPARAMRLLAESSRRPVVAGNGGRPAVAEGTMRSAVAELLRRHVLTHLELVDEVIPLLSTEAAAHVRAIADTVGAVVAAPLSAVPGVLADPPWRHRVKAVKPPVIAGLACTDAAAMSWSPGEHDEWARTSVRFYQDGPVNWAALARKVAAGKAGGEDPGRLFVRGPVEIARPVLAQWQPGYLWDATPWLRATAVRFGADALPTMLAAARTAPAEYGPLLLPFTSPELAVHMADWLARLKSVRRIAHAWLLRHPAEAARALVPPALSKPGVARRQAERALLLLHTNGHTEQVQAAAAGYGPEAADALEELLATDPLIVLPARMPVAPAWAAAALLPPVRLRDGSGALPGEAAANLVTMLAIAKPDDPYPGVEIVRQACEPADLAEFGWALFSGWQAVGAPVKESWALDALGLIGDDETVRRLSPLILAWPGEGGHAKAVTGINVLAGIGTDLALTHLHRISQRARFKGLKAAAVARMDEVAEGLGLTAEQLADRLVPDFGLDADGSLRLDYGPRQFVVGFDEQLHPFVTDGDGRRLKTLPKPGTRDDAAFATAAYQRFTTLKKDVRGVAADQVRRLEHAMVSGRRWTGTEFQEFFVGHPLVWHVARRLVWARFDADGTPIGTLRIAEDRTFAMVDDEPTTVADDEVVGIAHPLHLGVEGTGWAEVFADYEILQPFPQLGRQTFALTEEEGAGSTLGRFEGLKVATTSLLGLERRGWRREDPQDAGMQSIVERELGTGLVLSVEIEPGIAVGDLSFAVDQKLTSVFLHDGTGHRWDDSIGHVPLNSLDPVTASEVLCDLTEVTG